MLPKILLLTLLLLTTSAGALANEPPAEAPSEAPEDAIQAEAQHRLEQRVETLEAPLYTPFIERYLIDEVKSLRTELQGQRAEFLSTLNERELRLANHSVTYATDTVTYFFYLVAGVSSLLVLVGWTSIRDIKEKALVLTDQEVTKLISRYEKRLNSVEEQLSAKEVLITANAEALEQTNEVHALWLRASQEFSEEAKIAVYDQILKLRPDDVEALSYKADAVLELGEPKWAANLCHQALQQVPDNAHALYQLACACACLKQLDDASRYLEQAITLSPEYLDSARKDPQLKPLEQGGQLNQIAENLSSPGTEAS
ncbi:hypothetical protein GCM10025772_12480 [Ferrimonas gelatinilytica]|uniref:TPR repeat containing protein n=1 Tax=Ferrimonas gelatinilytica TaxID=1255257 RepID=A0ABP9S286_9GAMM